MPVAMVQRREANRGGVKGEGGNFAAAGRAGLDSAIEQQR